MKQIIRLAHLHIRSLRLTRAGARLPAYLSITPCAHWPSHVPGSLHYPRYYTHLSKLNSEKQRETLVMIRHAETNTSVGQQVKCSANTNTTHCMKMEADRAVCLNGCIDLYFCIHPQVSVSFYRVFCSPFTISFSPQSGPCRIGQLVTATACLTQLTTQRIRPDLALNPIYAAFFFVPQSSLLHHYLQHLFSTRSTWQRRSTGRNIMLHC